MRVLISGRSSGWASEGLGEWAGRGGSSGWRRAEAIGEGGVRGVRGGCIGVGANDQAWLDAGMVEN